MVFFSVAQVLFSSVCCDLYINPRLAPRHPQGFCSFLSSSPSNVTSKRYYPAQLILEWKTISLSRERRRPTNTTMNRRGNGSSTSSSDASPRGEGLGNEKIPQSEYLQREPSSEMVDVGGVDDLHRGLKARHITMIAIGGAVGTGLIIGT